MHSCWQKLGLLVALVSLMNLNACTGFFVNQPTSITVTTGANGGGSSSFTVAQGTTVQLFATGTFNNGNKDITSSATWQSSTPCATVNAGTVTGVGAITGVTITATLDGITGSASGDVTGNGSGLQIASVPSGTSFALNTTAVFTATLNGTDVTSSTTWTSGNSSIVTFSGNQASFVGQGTTSITGSYVANGTCAGASENVTVQ